MSKLKVYYMKEKDLNKWAEAGFDIMPNVPLYGGYAIYIEKKIPKDSNMVKMMMDNYDSDAMHKYLYNKDTQDYYTSIGVNYYKDSDGKLKLDRSNEKLMDTVTNVRLVIFQADEDSLLTLCPTSDWRMPVRIPAAKLVRPYFDDEIRDLIGKNLAGVTYMEATD